MIVFRADEQMSSSPPLGLINQETDNMTTFMKRFAKDESGATAIEYGLIAALIGCAIIGGATLLGGNLNSKFGAIATKVGTAAT